MAQQELRLPHRVTVDGRQALSVTGVSEVLGLDENAVRLQTSEGELWIHGKGLRLKNLTPEGGQLSVSGQVDALVYEENRQRGGWMRRLMG